MSLKKNISDFDEIIVLDFGSQYKQIITRRLRDFGIYSELLPHDISMDRIRQISPKGIIFSGGPNRSEERRVGKECRSRWVE